MILRDGGDVDGTSKRGGKSFSSLIERAYALCIMGALRGFAHAMAREVCLTRNAHRWHVRGGGSL